MNILLTGSTGQLGRALVPKLLDKGYTVYALLRDVKRCPEGCIPVKGDVTEGDLGMESAPEVEQLWNLAGDVNLRGNESSFKVNSQGAYNVAHFAMKHNLNRLVHVSTAYASEYFRNPYEHSKWLGESYVREVERGFAGFHEPVPTTIFKPSIVVADSKTYGSPGGAFYQFVKMMCVVHRRVELVRRKIEGTLRLPVIEPTFRLQGNPRGRLNLVPLDAVTDAIAHIERPGTFWLTNRNPPKLSDLAEWVGEVLLLKIEFKRKFTPTPLEAIFGRAAEPFRCYLDGDRLHSDLHDCPQVTREMLQHSILNYLL